MAITFWTLMAGVVLIAAAILAGHLTPALITPHSRDTLGLVGLGLFLAAHVASLSIGLRHVAETVPPAPKPALHLVERGA
jgi:uncharacterized membrane protein YhhN